MKYYQFFLATSVGAAVGVVATPINGRIPIDQLLNPVPTQQPSNAPDILNTCHHLPDCSYSGAEQASPVSSTTQNAQLRDHSIPGQSTQLAPLTSHHQLEASQSSQQRLPYTPKINGGIQHVPQEPVNHSERLRFIQHTSLSSQQQEKHPCPKCPSSFADPHNLRRHYRTHVIAEGDEPHYVCNECNIKIDRSDNWLRHQKTHSQEKSHKCDNCGKTFNAAYNLKRHKETACSIGCTDPVDEVEPNLSSPAREPSSGRVRPYVCDQPDCGQSFNRRDLRKRHESVHLNGRKKASAGSIRFVAARVGPNPPPETSSGGAKPYVCDYPGCGRSFARSDYRKKHIKNIHLAKKNKKKACAPEDDGACSGSEAES